MTRATVAEARERVNVMVGEVQGAVWARVVPPLAALSDSIDALIAAVRAEERERGFSMEQIGNAWVAVRRHLWDEAGGLSPVGTSYEEASAEVDAHARELVDMVVAALAAPTTEEPGR